MKVTLSPSDRVEKAASPKIWMPAFWSWIQTEGVVPKPMAVTTAPVTVMGVARTSAGAAYRSSMLASKSYATSVVLP